MTDYRVARLLAKLEIPLLLAVPAVMAAALLAGVLGGQRPGGDQRLEDFEGLGQGKVVHRGVPYLACM